MKDFILGASTYVIIGLSVAVAIFCIKSNKSKVKKTFIHQGMCIGMFIGAIAGIIFKEHLAILLGLGMLIGETIGLCIKKINNILFKNRVF